MGCCSLSANSQPHFHCAGVATLLRDADAALNSLYSVILRMIRGEPRLLVMDCCSLSAHSHPHLYRAVNAQLLTDVYVALHLVFTLSQ